MTNVAWRSASPRLTVSEGGDATYTVVLESEPTGTVTVTPSVSGNTEVTVSGTLTFTPGDLGLRRRR